MMLDSERCSRAAVRATVSSTRPDRSHRRRRGPTVPGQARRGRGRETLTRRAVSLADHVHVDRSRFADDPVHHRPTEELLPARMRAGADHDLGDVLGSGDLQQRFRDAPADHLAEGAAERPHELAGSVDRRRFGKAVLRDHVDRDEVAAAPRRHAGGAADQHLVVRAAGRPRPGCARASPTAPRCRGPSCSPGATRPPGRPSTGGRARAARRGCPRGSSCRGRRRSSPGG